MEGFIWGVVSAFVCLGTALFAGYVIYLLRGNTDV
jgi:hypothetical protein